MYLILRHKSNNDNGDLIPLQVAIQKSESIDIMEELLNSCGNDTINHQDWRGETSLHYAARFHKSFSQEMIRLLFLHGVDDSITNVENETAVDVARGRNFFYLQFLLK